ncbi:hypothetical protein AOLI_G00083090, partial [Acnodon oligacanthus]
CSLSCSTVIQLPRAGVVKRCVLCSGPTRGVCETAGRQILVFYMKGLYCSTWRSRNGSTEETEFYDLSFKRWRWDGRPADLSEPIDGYFIDPEGNLTRVPLSLLLIRTCEGRFSDSDISGKTQTRQTELISR